VGLLPYILVAYTVKVYDVPKVNPVAVIGELAPVNVTLPGNEVAV
jgi:hypothetical protein